MPIFALVMRWPFSVDDLGKLSIVIAEGSEPEAPGYAHLLSLLDVKGHLDRACIVPPMKHIEYTVWDPVLLDNVVNDFVRGYDDQEYYNHLLNLYRRQEVQARSEHGLLGFVF